MAKNSKKTSVSAISLEMSLLGSLEPVIRTLDKYYYDDNGEPNELHAMGHELPSRKDGMLRVLVNNFCRDVYQQIHGVKSENYNFSGAKDAFDRASNAVAATEFKYRDDPDAMEGDPNIARQLDWYEAAECKLHVLQTMLDDLQTVYKTITADEWKYTAPGTKKANDKKNVQQAVQSLRERLAAKAKATQTQAA